MIVNIRIRLQKGPATRGLARSHAHFTLSARPMSRVALDVARAGADEGEENAGACGRRGEGDGGGAGARHAPLLPMKFGCSSTLMLAAVLVTVHHITSSPSSNACDSCSSPFFTPRYSALLLGGIFSSAVMSSFRYLRHASHRLPLMGGRGGQRTTCRG